MSRIGDEQAQVLEFAYATMAGSAELADALGTSPEALPYQLWPDVAPADTAGLFVVYSTTDASDRNGIGGVPRLFSGVPLLVKITGATRSYDDLAPAARVLYRLFHGARNVPLTGGGMVLTCTRVGAVQYPETAEGIEYRHLGHQLQVEVN